MKFPVCGWVGRIEPSSDDPREIAMKAGTKMREIAFGNSAGPPRDQSQAVLGGGSGSEDVGGSEGIPRGVSPCGSERLTWGGRAAGRDCERPAPIRGNSSLLNGTHMLSVGVLRDSRVSWSGGGQHRIAPSRFVKDYNTNTRPVVRTATADSIIAKVARFSTLISGRAH